MVDRRYNTRTRKPVSSGEPHDAFTRRTRAQTPVPRSSVSGTPLGKHARTQGFPAASRDDSTLQTGHSSEQGGRQTDRAEFFAGPAFKLILLPLLVALVFVLLGVLVSCAGGFAVLS